MRILVTQLKLTFIEQLLTKARVREREDGSEGFGAGVKTAFSVSLFWAIVHEIVAEWKH